MKNTLTILPYVAIILLLIYFTQCNRPKPCPEVTTQTDTIKSVDTVTIEGQTVYYPSPYQVNNYDTAFKDVDTLKIISNYLAENKYELIISDDTNSKITLYASVQYNLLKDYRTDAVYYPHTTTIIQTNTIPYPKRNKLLLGLILGGNANSFGAVPVAGLKTKKDNVFLAGYDVLGGTAQVGYLFKIGKN